MALVSWDHQKIAARHRLDPSRDWRDPISRSLPLSALVSPQSKAQMEKAAMKKVAANWRALARNPEDEALLKWKVEHEAEIVRRIMEKRIL